jgi:hypothetical protein
MQRMGKNAGPAVADTGRALSAMIGLLALLNLLQGMLIARGTFCLTNEVTAFSWLPGAYRCEPLQQILADKCMRLACSL